MAGNSAFAQTRTWQGTVNSDWNNSANWQGGNIPGPTQNVNIPANSTHWPVINSTISIRQLTLTNWNGAASPLTVVTGGKLTITNGLTFAGGGQLHIDGGEVILSGGSFSSSWNEWATIEITTGSFISHVSMELNNGNNTMPALSIGDGSMTIYGDMKTGNDKWIEITNTGTLEVYGDTELSGGFYSVNGNIYIDGNFQLKPHKTAEIGSSILTVTGTTDIYGAFYADDGTVDFHGPAQVRSGGSFHLDTGSVNFHDFTLIGNNGQAWFGSGTVNFYGNSEIASGGYMHVQDATVNVVGDVSFNGNGNLTIDTGSLNIGGNAELISGGTMDLNNGNLNIEGNATFTGGSTVNAGNSTITLGGDISVQDASNFNPDTGTVVFSGGSEQTIHVENGDITFYDVIVEDGAVLQSDGAAENTIIIENSLTVNSGGNVIVQDDDQINIIGDLYDEDETVVIDRPFIRHITTPNLTTIVIEFDKDMKQGPLETIANYIINNGITVAGAVQNPSNKRLVTLTLSTPLTEGLEYELIANNQVGENNVEMLNNHIKRFGAQTVVIFYSRQSGNWGTNSSWSTQDHTGSSTTLNPVTTSGATFIIGSGHTITIASSINLTNMAAVTVSNTGTLVVGSGGILEPGSKIITGTGTFEVSTGTLNINHADGISAAGATGAVQTSTRVFGSSGTYSYKGSAAQQTGSGLPTQVAALYVDNTNGVQLTNNLEVTGTLHLQNGALIIPSGKNLIANSKSITSGYLEAQRLISGNKGWRQISSPVASTYADLLDNTVTQGYTGAFYSTGSLPGDTLQPNVMYYDETWPGTDNQRWRAPADAANQLVPGRGLYTYFFGDVAGDSRYNMGLPLTLTVQGQENEGNGTLVDFNITYTTAADSGWNLVGNPYAASINWDNNSEWTKTNVDQTIYIWDANTNTYKTWNGITGSLGNGIIAPFQGFWVKANAENPELQVNKTAKTFGDSFVGKQHFSSDNIPHISLTLSNGDNKASTHLMFSDDARLGKDAYDAYRLAPPPGISSFVDITTQSGGSHLAINNLPRRFGKTIEIPVYTDAFEDGISAESKLTITWGSENLPAGWRVTLIDNQQRAKVELGSSSSYTFTQKGSAEYLAPNYAVQGSGSKSRKARFLLQIEPGDDAADLPDAYKLEQNYPNPFNPGTTIQFNLPVQGKTELAIFDIIGRQVALLVQEELPAGTHSYTWNASGLSSGIYIYRLVTPETAIVKKMTLIK